MLGSPLGPLLRPIVSQPMNDVRAAAVETFLASWRENVAEAATPASTTTTTNGSTSSFLPLPPFLLTPSWRQQISIQEKTITVRRIIPFP